MKTTDLFRKHFGNNPQVDLKHPNIEKFFEELNEQCLNEDLQKITGWQFGWGNEGPLPETRVLGTNKK